MRAYAMAIFVLLAGCDSFKNVPCGQCEKYGAVCNPVTNSCQLGPLDMAVTVENDMAKTMVADLSTEDGPTPPMCTPATVTTDCVDATKPVCGSDGNCRACNSAGDDAVCKQQSPATPRCQLAGANAGTCVQCTAATQAMDCGGIAPICGSDGTCRKCQAHSECPALGMWPDGTAIPGVCIFDGVNPGGCADPALIAYVDNRGMSVLACNTGHAYDGTTPATAYCDVQDAVGAMPAAAEPYVVVRGRGTMSYGGSSTSGANVSIARSVTIIGPGPNAASTAQISSGVSATPCITIAGAVSVVLDGLEIGNSTSGAGVACNGTNSVLVARHNSIHSAGGGGVTANTCETTLDGNDIESNGFGVSLTMSKFSLTNNVIAGASATGAYGVKINDNPAGSVFAFNTVANNSSGVTAAPSGILCNAATTIQNSIVALNLAPAGTQFSGSCTLSNVVTGTDSANPGNTAGPAFTGNYRLDISTTQNELKNKTCCIDKLATPSTPFSDHDVDFTARPKGTGATPYDIGAAEAE